MTICAFQMRGEHTMRECVAVLVLVLTPGVVQAGQEGAVDVGGAAGFAQSLHGDLDFGDAAVSGTARVRVSRRVAFEGQFGYWQHRRPDAFLTSRGEVVQTRLTHKFPNVTASVLAVSDRDARVGPYGGAGVGVFYHISNYEQSGTSQFPGVSDSDWRIGVGATLVGGVDVRVSTRATAFGEFRFDVQSFRDPGSSTYRALGGVRLPIG
jgi:hypothetical protein